MVTSFIYLAFVTYDKNLVMNYLCLFTCVMLSAAFMLATSNIIIGRNNYLDNLENKSNPKNQEEARTTSTQIMSEGKRNVKADEIIALAFIALTIFLAVYGARAIFKGK